MRCPVALALALTCALPCAALDLTVDAVLGWLRPGGSFVFVEALPGDGEGPIVGPAGPLLPRDPESLGGHLAVRGFEPVEVGRTRTAFVYGEAIAPA